MKKYFVLSLLFLSSQSKAIVVNDWNGLCGAYKYDNVYALFEPTLYTCASGQFLPAAATICASCPAGYTCLGGTFYYNRVNAQGLTRTTQRYTQDENNACAANFHHNFIAVFVKNVVDCDSGQYLPSGTDVCTECPINNICRGGTYNYSENQIQGIEPCPNGYFSPTGSASVCYPHILHVGDDNIYLRSSKLTTPSLNFQIGNDIFYANMTTVRTKMNKDSDHYFHAQWENNHYYVCDDTTCPQ